MIKIAICDDEKAQRNGICKTITTLMELKGLSHGIYEFDCGELLLENVKNTDYNIIFLDIEMKAMDGIATAKNIRIYNKTAVIIFVTAYPDFVFQGYEVKALNYILKPYKKEKIDEVLGAALEELECCQDRYYAVETKAGTHRLNLSGTLYFYSDKRKLTAVTEGGSMEFYEKLDEMEKSLPQFFVRIHQRYLVNINYVSAVEGGYAIVLGEKLPISRNRMEQLLISFAKTMLG